MPTPQEIESQLRAAVPGELQRHLPRLAQLLADAATGALAPADALATLRDPALNPLLHALAGRQVQAAHTLLSFGAGNRMGNVTIRDVAGGHIITLKPRGDVVLGNKILPLGVSASLVLVIGLLVASVIWNIGPLSPIAQAVWVRFVPPFPPAQAGESLIIVADFADASAGTYDGVDPDQYIYRELRARIERDGLDIRIERLSSVLDSTTVRQAGEAYSATLVVWGAYDAVGITPYVERIKKINARYTNEEGQSILVDPERIPFSVVTDLPALSSYLVLFTLGADLRINEHLLILSFVSMPICS